MLTYTAQRTVMTHIMMSAHCFCGTEQVPPPLLKQDAFWIHTLQTLAPKGLNDELILNIVR